MCLAVRDNLLNMNIMRNNCKLIDFHRHLCERERKGDRESEQANDRVNERDNERGKMREARKDDEGGIVSYTRNNLILISFCKVNFRSRRTLFNNQIF